MEAIQAGILKLSKEGKKQGLLSSHLKLARQ